MSSYNNSDERWLHETRAALEAWPHVQHAYMLLYEMAFQDVTRDDPRVIEMSEAIAKSCTSPFAVYSMARLVVIESKQFFRALDGGEVEADVPTRTVAVRLSEHTHVVEWAEQALAFVCAVANGDDHGAMAMFRTSEEPDVIEHAKLLHGVLMLCAQEQARSEGRTR